MKANKTNAMRMLDRAKIPYDVNYYEVTEQHMDGIEIADVNGIDRDQVYKTLVVENAQHQPFVCVTPVTRHLDLKRAANILNEKKLSMLPLDQLKKVTGYERGGCAPIGMKHPYPIVVDEAVEALDTFNISGGRRGAQIVIDVHDFLTLTKAITAPITK